MIIDWMIQYCSMLILPKLIHRFNMIPIKIPAAYFSRNWQTNAKFCIEKQ